jgi:uncharacterized membrane protein YciS (DUF1049 family)
MRFICLVLLIVFVVAVSIFAVQNHDPVTITYFDRNLTCSLALLIGAVYVLGMLSGWTVVGVLKRSIQRVSEPRRT